MVSRRRLLLGSAAAVGTVGVGLGLGEAWATTSASTLETIETGLDYSWDRPNLDQVKAAGYRFVVRYLSFDTTGKNISVAELHSILTHGLRVALVWEYGNDAARGGAAVGQQHGAVAAAQATSVGYELGATIYVAVDFDASPDELAGSVSQYLAAAAIPIHAAGYRFGVYGGIDAVDYALDHGLANDGWQTYAWSEGKWGKAALRQVLNGQTVGGAAVDLDERRGATYFMPLPHTRPTPGPSDPPGTPGDGRGGSTGVPPSPGPVHRTR